MCIRDSTRPISFHSSVAGKFTPGMFVAGSRYLKHANGAAGPASAYLGEPIQTSDEPIEALLLDEKSLSLLRSG